MIFYLLFLTISLSINLKYSFQLPSYQLAEENEVKRKSIPVQCANPGDTATGSIVEETDEKLILNTTPCFIPGSRMIFKKPYKKEDTGPINCKDNAYKQVTVTQKE